MNNQNRLIIKQLDSKMQKMKSTSNIIAPPNGWIRAIRTALGIPRRLLAKKLGITEPTLQKIEEREVTGAITLRTLRKTAESMDLIFIYGFIPKDGSLQNFVKRKAYEAAKKLVLRTAHTMSLEDQAISDKRINAAIKEKTQELESKLPNYLWE